MKESRTEDEMTTTDEEVARAYAEANDPSGMVEREAVAYLEERMTADEAAEAVRKQMPVATSPETDAAVDKWKAGTDLVEREAELPSVSRWQQMEAMAKQLSRSKLMPKHIRESNDPEADCIVVLLLAHDLGLSSTVAFQKVNVIEGKPAMSAELMRMLIRRDGHRLWVTIDRDERGRPIAATTHGIRKDDPANEYAASFSLDDAVAASLCKIDDNGNPVSKDSHGRAKPWEKYTEDLLVARSSSRWARRYGEDCLAGVSYTPEELGDVLSVDNETPVPPSPQCTDEQLADVREKLTHLDERGRVAVQAEWKERKYGNVQAIATQTAKLRQADFQPVLDLIERHTPAEGEVVDEETDDVAEQSVKCGKLTPDSPHNADEDLGAH
jgi:hypothetical protein